MRKICTLAIIFCGLPLLLLAQKESVSYYYKGHKLNVPVSYKQVQVLLKPAESLIAHQPEILQVAGLKAANIKSTGVSNQYTLLFDSTNSDVSVKKVVSNLLSKDYIGYARPSLLSSSGKLVSYGDEFVVKLKSATSYASLIGLATKLKCTVLRKYSFQKNIYILSAGMANKYDALNMANRFYESKLFEYASPDFTIYHGFDDANDPLYYLQWAHKNTGSAAQYNGVPGADMRVDSAWQITMGNSNIKIAVIDEGVDTGHADLKANLLQGYDATSGSSGLGAGNPTSPNNAHGTNCAGIIGAIARPDKIQFVSGLPKTRSGKIMRRILRKIAEGDTSNLGDTSTLLDPGVVDEIKNGAL